MPDSPRIRVLFVYPYLPHYRYDVFKRLEGHPNLEVEFAAGPNSRDGSILTVPGEVLDKFHPLRNVWFWKFLWQFGVFSVIVRRRPDVVVFHGESANLSTWAGAVLARLLKSAVLFWTIGWHRPDSGLRRHFRLAYYRLADELLIYGKVGRAIGVDMGYPYERMTVIYNSSSGPIGRQKVDPAALERFNDDLPAMGEKIVSSVIRLYPVKRLDMLVQATAALRSAGRPVVLLLVGDGPERERLAALARQLEVPLYMPGAAYTDEALRLVYERTLVTVVPSLAGLTVLQSLKFGCPVITHDNMYEQVPECEAIVPGATGDFYRYGDVDHLALTLGRWIDRQTHHRAATAQHCRDSLQREWNADVQAEIISKKIVNHSKGIRSAA